MNSTNKCVGDKKAVCGQLPRPLQIRYVPIHCVLLQTRTQRQVIEVTTDLAHEPDVVSTALLPEQVIGSLRKLRRTMNNFHDWGWQMVYDVWTEADADSEIVQLSWRSRQRMSFQRSICVLGLIADINRSYARASACYNDFARFFL